MAAARGTGGGSGGGAPSGPAAGAGYAGRARLPPTPAPGSAGAAGLGVGRPAQRSGALTELKLACQGRVGERKLELVRGGPDLCSRLCAAWAEGAGPGAPPPPPGLLLRWLLASLRHRDLLRCLHHAWAPPQGRDLRAASDQICDNVGSDWRRLAPPT